MTTRQQALEWWNGLRDDTKCFFTREHYDPRTTESLTGREIEQIYLREHPKKTELTDGEKAEVINSIVSDWQRTEVYSPTVLARIYDKYIK